MFSTAEIVTQNPVMGTTIVHLSTTKTNNNNDQNDDDSPSQQQHHIGLDSRRPNETLSGGSVEKTFEHILKSTNEDKDIFTQDSLDCKCCCSGLKPYFWIVFGVFLILGSIALIVVMAMGLVDLAAISGVIYGFMGGIICILIACLLHERIFEIDKRNKVIRTQTNFTFMDCANTCCGRNEQEIKFEDIDYVSIENVRDGFFDEDWIEDPTVKNEIKRVPVKVARRNMYLEEKKKEQQKKNKKTSSSAAAASSTYNTIATSSEVPVTEQQQQQQNSTTTATEGSDAWLRSRYLTPCSNHDKDNAQAAVTIRLYRKGAHSEVETNNKDRNKQISQTRSVTLESVSPKDGLQRIQDWEAYLGKLGVPLRRSVPNTSFLSNRRLINPYDTGVEEIKTSANIQTPLTFWLLIVPTLLAYVGLIVSSQVFAVEGEKRRDAEMAALNITKDEPGWDKQISILPWQAAVLIICGVFLSTWMFFTIWFFARKVVLVVNKHNRTFTHAMTRYGCCCSSDTPSTNDKDTAVFKFQDVRRLEIGDQHQKSGGTGKSSLSNRTVDLVYFDTTSNQEKSVTLQTSIAGSILPFFRAWKRYLIEDLKIELNQQPEDKMFEDFLRSEGELDAYVASLKKNNNSTDDENGIPAWYKKAKELDPSLYVDLTGNVAEEDEKSPMIM